jgi:toxin ParE1/3/4
MARVIIARSADADMDVILADLATKAGQRVSAKYGNLFDRLYDRVAVHPGIGASCPAIGPGARIGIVSPYVVIYRYAADSDTVTVLRIV